MFIDAHQHFWQLGAYDCHWPTPDLGSIYTSFGPDELAPLMKRCGIEASVLVQSQPSDRDTDWLLALAKNDESIVAVVGWLDLQAPDAPARVGALAAHPKLKGLRLMLQDFADVEWIFKRSSRAAIESMIDHGLCLDALIFPRHLSTIRRLARRYPQLPIVVDHAAKPAIVRGILDPWRADLLELAALPNLYCKLSGLLTEAEVEWQPADLRPYVDHVLAAFAPDRLMWGSDWPVVNLACDYVGWWMIANEMLASRSPSEKADIFGETARRFYRL